MKTTRRSFLLSGLAAGMGAPHPDALRAAVPTSPLLEEVRTRVMPVLKERLKEKKLAPGQPVHLRVFKESKELELWMQPKPGTWRHFKTWPIATWGEGTLGPKQREGDGQAPEGFYAVGPKQLNPNSKYHLAFNLGYPNAFDQALGRTGSFLMVHGAEVSIGCFAMTNVGIEEIYLLVEAALNAGQEAFAVHIFPFRMTAERLSRESASPWRAFWENLKEGWDRFEKTTSPPIVRVKDGRYHFPSA